MQSISQGCHEMEDFEVLVSGIFKDQPIYDKSPDDEEQISTMIQMELLSNNLVYENYEADYLESSGGYDIEITKKHLGFWYELNMHHDLSRSGYHLHGVSLPKGLKCYNICHAIKLQL
jgi:hypothetical protein